MNKILLLVLVASAAFAAVYFATGQHKISSVSSTIPTITNDTSNVTPSTVPNEFSETGIQTAVIADLPLAGSAPTVDVQHSIPLDEIRRGCFRQDCIPSVDTPEFITVDQADDILPEDTIGIALSHKGINRFYPFNMLVTREIVNEVIEGDPILITYCPLCGTGVVFERSVNGVVYEFGVSGMLWQSNLLMYNRAENLADRNLWSQVLGTAVVGKDTGTKLRVIPSDIMKYTTWRTQHPAGQILNTGRIGDPYGGQYYEVARSFAPSFDEQSSELDPSAYVYGIEVGGSHRAYERALLPEGVTTDTVSGEAVTITRTGETVVFESVEGVVPDLEGFWFSWKAAHPDTTLWKPAS